MAGWWTLFLREKITQNKHYVIYDTTYFQGNIHWAQSIISKSDHL
jgi:hypothetical protein